MSRRKEMALLAAGVVTGAAVFGGGTALASLTAQPSAQRFYLDGRRIPLEAYTINGNNYVKLRDIAQAVGFGVTYDAATNTVTIHPDQPHEKEVSTSQEVTPNIPKTGDVIHCDDGTSYTITDVSRYDKSAFASGPAGPLPEPVCDWAQFDQPDLPEAEARRFNDPDGDYLFVRNLYELQRMLYTLYNAMGSHTATWKDGQAVRRSDGTPWVHIQLSLPKGESVFGFWPWSAEEVTGSLAAAPCGDRCMEAWDVYKDGVFQRTEYKMK